MPLFNILVGAALLLFGRRLFWLFVAGVGFFVGALLTTELLGREANGVVLVIALAVGLVGALVSIFLQKFVIAIAGFLAGGFLLYLLAVDLGYQAHAWIAFLIGGVLGWILLKVLFDWALIALSALTGAAVITQHLPMDRALSTISFFALAGIGALIQAKQLRPAKPATKPPPPDSAKT